jgi:hypothetical protein
VRAARIPPGALRAPEGRVPPPRALGTGIPSSFSEGSAAGSNNEAGFQEKRMEADAWAGVAASLRQVVASSESKEQVYSGS